MAVSAMKTAMKVKKTAMKTVMKAKKVSKIAKGRLAKALVLNGKKEKTSGGLTRDALMRNKRGKIVSKRASALGKRQFKNIEEWVGNVKSARKQLALEGFVAINGKSLQGKALYVKAKALRSSRVQAAPALASPAKATPASSPVKESTPTRSTESIPAVSAA
mmetsp:Transcript_158056/g.274402  ORF Transcript_158056/g.274402 Transcript_158056/m.274402 type:complete len:162 (-) Transcript_158056:337-822(-)